MPDPTDPRLPASDRPDDRRRAVDPMDPAAWAELGLVELDGDTGRRDVVLMPTGAFVLARDACLPDGSRGRDHVMGVNGLDPDLLPFRDSDPGPVDARPANCAAATWHCGSRRMVNTSWPPKRRGPAVAMARSNTPRNRIDHEEMPGGASSRRPAIGGSTRSRPTRPP